MLLLLLLLLPISPAISPSAVMLLLLTSAVPSPRAVRRRRLLAAAAHVGVVGVTNRARSVAVAVAVVRHALHGNGLAFDIRGAVQGLHVEDDDDPDDEKVERKG